MFVRNCFELVRCFCTHTDMQMNQPIIIELLVCGRRHDPSTLQLSNAKCTHVLTRSKRTKWQVSFACPVVVFWSMGVFGGFLYA